MRRLSSILDHSWPVVGGLAGWAHCLFGSDRIARWLRTNDDYEPEALA